ncbi:MAG TPA: alkaline phosphatase family protein [Candidatus Nitrosotalea sp.]|nr:alkaline phosphatase family protein [Candidatus Nitrosotalea sp.]
MKFLLITALGLCFAGCAPPPGTVAPSTAPDRLGDAGPHAAQVTIVLMENKDYSRVVGNPQAPYFNGTFIPQGVLLRNSHAIGHPSEPNYLALFSGSTQGIHGDPCPRYFKAANIASELIAAGKTFAGYAESMPRDGYQGCYKGVYDRNHNPWVEFRNVPSADNLVYRGFPSKVASFVWITPNLCHDMHNCPVKDGDQWLSNNLPPIIAWDKKHDGLLIVTWDEAAPDNGGRNHVATVLVGPMIRAGGDDTQRVDHYAVLRTIEKILGVACIANDCHAPLITGIWN